MENLIAKIKDPLKKAKKQLEIKLKKLFVEQNRRFVMTLVIVFAVVIAGINVTRKLNNDVTVKAQDNSILVSLLYGEGDIEVVTNESPVVNEKRLSPITVASAAPLSEDQAKDSSTNNALPSSVLESNITTLKRDTLIKDSGIETKLSIKPREKPITYTVLGGDTISLIASKFDIDEATILQENKKYADDIIKPGDKLTILPLSGTTERVDQGENLADIAKKHNADLDDIIAFNKLENADDIEYAQILIIPGGKRESKNKPQPVIRQSTVLAASSTRSSRNTVSSSTRSSSVSNPVVKAGGRVSNRFPWGWCTWYVAQKRGDVNWRGNAGTWLNGARGAGRATGGVPAVGAIMVTSESGYGHVAYVEAVNGNQVTISEMNYRGFGIVSTRTISSGNRVIKGYVY